jgi:hypothetical protein
VQRRGSNGGGAGARRGPNNDREGDWRGAGMDPTVVEDPSGRTGGGEMIVVRVRV